MTDRPKITIPFGGGVNRESGILGTDARTMADLRNIHLLDARIEVRKGLGRAVLLGDAGDTLLNIHPVRSRSMAAYLLRSPIGELKLWASAADGSGASELVTIAPADAGGVQQYILDDNYDKLFIAHDEADIIHRQPTRYWDFNTSTLEILHMPFDSANVVRFRGVATHLAYLLGWAWGAPGDEDRPETLRISLAGEPQKFDPQHYFLVGVRGEPIVGGGLSGSGWSIKKITSGHRLLGDSRANFGVVPVENLVGLPRHTLGTSVNGVYYFWSSDGPRRDTGGISEDLSPGLRLLDTPPDALAAIDVSVGFTVYDPTRKEVIFVFGKWAFVYHLAANPERWSYREYGVILGCGAVLYASDAGALVIPPDADYTFTLDDMQPSATPTSFAVTAHFAGPHTGSERFEVWLRSELDGVWFRQSNDPIGGVTDFTVPGGITGLTPSIHYDVATRTTRSGAPQADSVSSDPMDWPAGHRQMAVLLTIDDPTDAGSFPGGFVTPAEPHQIFWFVMPQTASDELQPSLVYEAEVDPGTGFVPLPDSDIAPYVAGGDILAGKDIDAYNGTTVDLRVRRRAIDPSDSSLIQTSAWLTLLAEVIPVPSGGP